MLRTSLPAGRGAHRGPAPPPRLPLAQVPGGRWVLAHIADRSQSHGKLFGQCRCLDAYSLGFLVAAGGPGGKAAELLLPALAEGAALASRGTGQHAAQLSSLAGLGAEDGTPACQALSREPF